MNLDLFDKVRPVLYNIYLARDIVTVNLTKKFVESKTAADVFDHVTTTDQPITSKNVVVASTSAQSTTVNLLAYVLSVLQQVVTDQIQTNISSGGDIYFGFGKEYFQLLELYTGKLVKNYGTSLRDFAGDLTTAPKLPFLSYEISSRALTVSNRTQDGVIFKREITDTLDVFRVGTSLQNVGTEYKDSTLTSLNIIGTPEEGYMYQFTPVVGFKGKIEFTVFTKDGTGAYIYVFTIT